MMAVRYFLVVITTLLLFIRPAAAQTLSFDVSDVHCNGDASGFIDLSVTGGTLPLTYLWSNNLTTEDIANLTAGTYTVTVMDGAGATVTGSGTVNEPAALELNTSVMNVRCNGESNGSIALSVSGGVLPYAYQWTGGPTSPNLNGCAAGVYSVTVTDANGCTAISSATVQEPQLLSWSAGFDNPSCAALADGMIDLTASGGTAPYNYYWSNGSIDEDQNALTAGTYTVTIIDANACLVSASFTLSVNSNITITPGVMAPTCGNADGAINLAVSGGTNPYTYLWSNGSTSSNLSNLGTGIYTVTVTDSDGCFSTAIQSIAPLGASISPSFAPCAYNLSAITTSGTEPFTFLWSNGSTAEQQTGVPGGYYSLTVTDATGCTAVVNSVYLTPYPAPVAGITTIDDVCTGGLLAYGVNFNASSYQWSTGFTTSKISNIPAGTYSVTLSSQFGCTASATITTTQELSSASFTLNNSVTQVSCFEPNSGAINLNNPTGSAPPLSFLWSNGATTPSIGNLSAGMYTLTVSDANGCTRTLVRPLVQPPPPVITLNSITPSDCSGLGAINISVSGGSLPYAYSWSNGIITQDIQSLQTGTYYLTVSGSNGCTATAVYMVPSGPIFSVAIAEISNTCSSVTLQPVISGASGPFAWAWTGPNGFTSNTQFITVGFSGTYTLVVTSQAGCVSIATYHVEVLVGGACGSITGNVIYDLDSNCIVNPGEFGLSGWLIRAMSATDTIYGATNPAGDYLIVGPVGDYVLETLPPNALWTVCAAGTPVSITENNTTLAGSILVKGLIPCPALSVSIGTAVLRRCFSNNSYQVQYCNQGTAAATGAFILLSLDPFLSPLNSSLPYTNLGGGLLRFDVGNLEVSECGAFYLNVLVSCNAVLGQTHCTEAHIYPDGSCLPIDPEWSGASLRVSSQCTQDSVRFTIQNIGTGDMQETSDYIVVEDAVMLMQAPFQLASGDSTTVTLPANGSTWRIEVDQVSFHPGMSAPGLSVEGCTTAPSFSTGFVTQFPNNEEDPWIDIDCTQNIGAFDPNDKQGFPVGYGEAHYIRPGTELEYLIRFQNTGTDTAFTVRIVDTLSLWLDPTTIRPGVSSHTYQFNFTGQGIAEFLFENILLPDSNVNQVASNGFVKFSVSPRADAPLETLIENSAAIYFDFNEPVITNTTRHRLGENFLMTVGAWQPQRPEYEVLVSPNPFSNSALLEVKGLTSSLPIHLQVFDLQGNAVHDETAAGPVLHLKKGSLKTGLYLFRLDQKGVLVGSGKLMVKD